MALYACAQKLVRYSLHFSLVIMVGSAVKGIKLVVKFAFHLDKLLYPRGVFRKGHGSATDSLNGLLHCYAHRSYPFLHLFSITEGNGGYDIGVGAVVGHHFLNKRIWPGLRR
jgi:hypothetical protein